MQNNRTWLTIANEDYCNHRQALKEKGYVSWTTKVSSKFRENDIVYLFMNDDRAVRFKLKVTKVNVPREDSAYWIKSAPKDLTYRLELVNEYKGNLLNEDVLENIGFKGGNSILTPICNNTMLLEYINDVFDFASRNVALPSHYIVVDLESGSYWRTNIGHEVFNLEKNVVDGRFYGYIPSHDDPNIKQLGASSKDKYVDGVMVVYVKKLQDSKDRKIIAFIDNARVYAKKQSGKRLNRYIQDNGKRIECTYTIESDYIYDLRTEPESFVFKVEGDDLQMFRRQRFYTGRRPRQEVKMLLWITDYLQRKNMEEDNDFQIKIQKEDNEDTLSDTSELQPCYNIGISGRTIAKKASVSKKALRVAKYKCVFDETHNTFVTNKGIPYMEGHHLIPCTISNTEYYWSKFNRNIDCVENIVSLCPTCHRRIHFGSKEEKVLIIRALYKKQISKLRNVGIDITEEELLALYL